MYIARKRVLWVLAAALLTSAALYPLYGVAQTDKVEKKGLIVTVLLFSGRPDPVYVLAEKEMLDQVKKSIEAAKDETAFDKPTIISSNLGYKGVLVDNAAGVPGIPARFVVYKGTIEIRAERTKFVKDEGGALEKFLLDQAIEKGAIDEKMMKRMREGTYMK